jgi:MFS family permease
VSALPRDARLLIAARALRGLGDGAVSVLLPVLLLERGLGERAVGDLTSVTLLGSALATLALGLVAHRVAPRRVLLAACGLLAATGLGLAFAPSYGWLLAIGFLGTFNPTAGDLTVFLPTEQALLAGSGTPAERTARFARYNVAGAVGGFVGGLVPAGLALLGVSAVASATAALLGYAALGPALAALYLRLGAGRTLAPATGDAPRAPLRESRGIVVRLAALFSLDSFGGGFAVQSILVVWLAQRFEASVFLISVVMGVSAGLSGASQFAAPALARRIGLIRTMVYTHLPANVFLIAAAFMPSAPLAIACLWLRASLSQMDVPARQAYVMSVVPETERAAAASVTNVPRSLGGVASPWLAGQLLAAGALGWPLVLGGAFKIAYDLLLLAGFRRRPAEGERFGA